MRDLAPTFSAGDPIYVGRPSMWGNPFEGRPMVDQARATILHRHWLAGHVSRRVFRACRFSEAEMVAMERWRDRVLRGLPKLRGYPLRCACRPDAAWCHAGTLLLAANP